jgi:hypothetical protein
MFVAVLAAYGYQLLVARWSPPKRRAMLAVVGVLLLVEYRASPALEPYVSSAPPLYRALAGQPRGVVLELPVPRVNEMPGDEARYAYLSTFYWFPLVNGYSGFFPASYLERLDRLRHFPDERSLRQIHADGVKYVIVHASGYSEIELSQISARLRALGMAELGTYSDGVAPAILFRAP